eukprot:gene5168-7016_t
MSPHAAQIERALAERRVGVDSKGTEEAGCTPCLKSHPVQVSGAMQDALDDESVIADRMENQIAAVDGDPDAHAVLLAQRIGFRLIGDAGAMGPQFRDEGQGAPGARQVRDTYSTIAFSRASSRSNTASAELVAALSRLSAMDRRISSTESRRACNIDPDVYQGFAWGMGIDRIAMLKYGIGDLRQLFEGDVRFLSHYGFRPLDVPNHLDTDETLEALADKLTMIGLEVEHIDDKAKLLKPFTIAEIVTAEQHPNADRLRVCSVNVGDATPLQIVCGAPNARAGLKTVLARP